MKKSRSFMEQWAAWFWPCTHSSLYFPLCGSCPHCYPHHPLCYWYHLSFKNLCSIAALGCVFYVPVTLDHCHLAACFGSVHGNLEITYKFIITRYMSNPLLTFTDLFWACFLSSAPSSEASTPFTSLALFLLAPEWSQMFLQYLLFHNSFPIFHFVWRKGQD